MIQMPNDSGISLSGNSLIGRSHGRYWHFSSRGFGDGNNRMLHMIGGYVAESRNHAVAMLGC